MLLEGAVTWARSLAAALEVDDFEAIAEASERSRSILVTLGTDLDTRVHPYLASRLASLHAWLYRCVVEAQCPADLAEVVELLEFQRDAWREAVSVLRRGDGPGPSGPIDIAG